MSILGRSSRGAAIASLGSLFLAIAVSSAVHAAVLRSPATAGMGQHLPTMYFRGQRIVVGSAAAKARDLQRRMGPNNVVWPTNGAVFVADPSINGIMVYDELQSGPNQNPRGVLAGPNTLLDGPVAVTVGMDCPNSVCQEYLWVSNGVNGTISQYSLPLTSWNQAPVNTPVSSNSQN